MEKDIAAKCKVTEAARGTTRRRGGNALNLSSRRMHCRIQPTVHCSDCIAGTAIAHVKVIAHRRPEWKLAGIINEKWERVAD